ncbi:MAG TPA: hypothetical protein VGA36_07560 [Nitriliruptorales bacterium]
MRIPALAALLLSIVVSATLPAGATAPPVTFAVGEVTYALQEDSGIPPSCAGNGTFSVTFQAAAARVLVAGAATGCVPVWSLISQCHYLADATVRCLHDGIDVTLAPDGRFDYVWDGPGFREEMHGALTRVG